MASTADPTGAQPSVQQADGGFRITGPVTIATALVIIEAARTQWSDSDTIVNFDGVTEADSAALALIFKWQRDAARKGHRILCHNIPDNVKALARLYGVEELIESSQ
jgi:phospholipid transport system transporter-binding protein